MVLRGKFFFEVDLWLRGKMDFNNSFDKIFYDLDSYNCMIFVIDLVDVMGLDLVWKFFVVVLSVYIE